jgi:hypothetical protein
LRGSRLDRWCTADQVGKFADTGMVDFVTPVSDFVQRVGEDDNSDNGEVRRLV